MRTLTTKHRLLYVVVAAVVVLGGLVSAYYAGYALDWTTSTDRARSDKNAERTVDREQPAFVSTITPRDYEQNVPEALYVLLDRPLTASEQAALTGMNGDASQVWAFMKPLGGRIVERASYVAPFEDGNENRGESQTFHLNLNSDRSAGITINGMTAVKDACGAPTAQTVVDIPPAGSQSRQGLLWDMTGGKAEKPKGPYVLDEGDTQGELFFHHNVVDLGSGQSSMAFTVQPEVSTHTCAWHIDVSYIDTSGYHTQRIPKGNGTITTEAVPRKPLQYFRYITTTGWGCVGEMSQKGCTATEHIPRG
ncbi:hypothetical protein [Streptomyces californicus]|uniref:hypothetical protein n=1 Tax=Streptomyces californicus TaxID=67351 RepID=UPI00378836A0